MKALWALFVLAIAGGNSATAGLEANVTYEGKYVGSREKVYLMLREAPHRKVVSWALFKTKGGSLSTLSIVPMPWAALTS